MTTRSEREKAQKLNEQHQVILSKMLREDDNKYCADCEAKGPRWASWNLGVFICIRCAGIHRNLGVHISRVKSVNLDQWTSEQIQSVVDMGNTKARQLYEALLPDNFKRPQTDQAVEFFIRDKYERKKYYDKNGLSTAPKEREKKKEEKKEEKKREKDRPSSSDKKREELQVDSKASPRKSSEPAVDLLGLAEAPAGGAATRGSVTGAAAPISDDLDIFGPMQSNPLPSSNNEQLGQTDASKAPAAAEAVSSSGGSAPAAPQGGPELFSESGGASAPSRAASGTAEEGAKKPPLSKDSILSLYSSSTATPPLPAQGPAAIYMGQPQMQFPAQAASNFQSYPGGGGAMPPAAPMMGGAMGQGGGGVMGQNSGVMVGVAMPNGYMGLQPGVVGGAMPSGAGPAQCAVSQQAQWNMNQMTQQMAGVAMGGPGAVPGGFVQSGVPTGAWSGVPSGQTLSTQLWK